LPVAIKWFLSYNGWRLTGLANTSYQIAKKSLSPVFWPGGKRLMFFRSSP